jgi:hypothetical protein
MLVRLLCCLVLTMVVLMPHGARAGCAEDVSKLMSRDTERLTTRFNRVARQAQQRGAGPRVVKEECRIARQLKPRLEDQLAALKQSGCAKDPKVGTMIADIVRGHEHDLAAVTKTATRSECR